MKKTGIAIIAAIALLAAKILKGVQALKIGLKSYEFGKVNVADGTIGMSLYFEIYNPLWVGVTLKEISGTLYASSGEKIETIGTVYNRYNYFIRGNATHIVSAQVTVNAKSTLAAAIQNIQSGDINNLLVTFDGKLVFGGTREVALPIKRTMTISDLLGK